MRVMVRTGWADLQRMKAAYDQAEPERHAPEEKETIRSGIASQAEDWLYFHSAKPELGGMRTERVAFSPSLGVYRGLTEADKASLNICCAETYQRVFRELVPDPVDLLAISLKASCGPQARREKPVLYDRRADDAMLHP